jgi:putative ABC transport system permease protein
LGAKFRQVATQLLMEGALLGLTGAVAGIAISPFLAATLVRLLTNADPGDNPYSSAVDARVLAFSVLLTLVVTLLFSVAPVLHYLRPDLAMSLRQNAGTASRAAQRFRKAAVGVQIALSILLLGGAGLFLRTLQNLDDQPVGFVTQHLATFDLNPAFSGYSEAGIAPVLWSTLDAIRRIPGVKFAAGTTDRELATDSHTDEFLVQGHRPVEGENMDFETAWITPSYFATLHQPLLTGREFSQADGKGAAKTAIVNLAFAKRFYGSAQNALGREIGDVDKGNATDITIVGVAGNVKHYDLRSEIAPAIYLPYLQLEHPQGMQIYIRSAQEPEAVEASIRRAVQSVNPLLVVNDLWSMQSQVESSAVTERALAVLSLAIAVLSISLAAVGLYGVLAYSTQNRIREIGVRLALGSPRRLVVALIVREMAWISVGAAIIAIPSTVALAQLFRSQLYGVAVFDPRSLTAALLLTSCLLLSAAALPARRAASVDPNQALREE